MYVKKSISVVLAFAIFFSFNLFFIKNTYASASYGYTYTVGVTSGTNLGKGITTDVDGNVYTVGEFSGSNINFNTTGSGSPDLKTASGSYDIFITKINADGSYGYTYTIGSTGYDTAADVATDSNGNIYVVGGFSGTNTNFNTTGSGSPDLKTSNGTNDMFLTKINANGSYGYTYTAGGTSDEYLYKISIDASNNMYMVGSFFSPSVNFNLTPSGPADTKTNNGSNDGFLTKVNADGSYGFTYGFGGASDDFAYSVATDPSGNIYTTGTFRGTNVQFNTTGSGSSDLHTSQGGTADIFLTKINSNGSYGYTYTVAGSGTDKSNDIATDASGNIYLVGNFSNANVDFNGTGSGSPDLKNSQGGSDIFLTKINANGSYGFTYTMGSFSSDQGFGVSTDYSGNVYMTGSFYGSVDFNTTGSGSSDIQTANNEDTFITRINSDGTYGFTYTLKGQSTFDDVSESRSIQADTLGNLYVTGWFGYSFGSGVNFNPFGTDIKVSNSDNSDHFITKLSGIFSVQPSPTPTPTPSPTSAVSSGEPVVANTQTNSIPRPPVCSDEKPESASYIFQADASKTKVVLHINPSSGKYNKYYIAYGTRWEGDEQYGVEFKQEHSTGALTYTINSLAPNTVYYFKVRAGNGCMPGNWSNDFKIKTTSSKSITKIYTTFTLWLKNIVLQPQKIFFYT